MTFQEKLKIRNQTKVDGYIRDVEKGSFLDHEFYRNIPQIINDLCIERFNFF